MLNTILKRERKWRYFYRKKNQRIELNEFTEDSFEWTNECGTNLAKNKCYGS